VGLVFMAALAFIPLPGSSTGWTKH